MNYKIYYKERITMKKLFSLILSLSFIATGFGFNQALAADTNSDTVAKTKVEKCAKCEEFNSQKQLKQNFEKRLNLSKKQKEKAKKIHQKGFEQMKPVMEKIKTKHQEIETIKANKELSEQQKQEQIKTKVEELKALNKQAHEIRKANSQEFEKILNKNQKKELEKMKAEGRAKFEKKHPPRKPFDMFGAPNFWGQRPLFPPVQPPTPKEEK